ncbi:MAG: 1,4-alpha-glucan branching protein domain-containing protein [Caldisericia bacterium]
MKNNLFIFLHSHLPFSLNKGRWPFGEEWLFEISLSTYLPLLKIFHELKDENIEFNLNLGITPVLMDQLKSEYFKEKFLEYIEIKEKNGLIDYEKYKNNPKIISILDYYMSELNDLKKLYEKINFDIVDAFNKLQNEGYIEIGTSAITHAYLPLLKYDESREMQIKNGVIVYKKYINKNPNIIWLPECAYKPGIEKILKETGINFFILNYHSLIEESEEIFRYGRKDLKFDLKNKFSTLFLYETDYEPYVLLRNPETSESVWSRDYGYPGDGDYREFHKKSENSGFQYWRITDKNVSLGDKDYYDFRKANEKAKIHALDFKNNLEKIFTDFNNNYDLEGLIVAAYDTELFGHWWYEGVQFIKELLKLSSNSDIYKTTTTKNLIKEAPIKKGKFSESSWGLGGYHYTWLNSETMWIWEKIHEIEDKFMNLKEVDLEKLKTLLKEKFLLESSDFPFLVTTSTAKDYAINRFNEHYKKFLMLLDGKITPEEINKDDFVFNDINLRRF